MVYQITGILILALSIWFLWFVTHTFFYSLLLVLAVLVTSFYRKSKTWASYNHIKSSEHNPKQQITYATVLRGEKIARLARNLSEQSISYENIHYAGIEKTLASETLDCSSFVRRVIYLATKIDIGNLMSTQFATSNHFIAFKQQSHTLPGDIVHVRGHVAICLDKGCRTVAEAIYSKNGLIVHSSSKSAISHTWSTITYYRLKPH